MADFYKDLEDTEKRHSLLHYLPLEREAKKGSFCCCAKEDGWDGCVQKDDSESSTCWMNEDDYSLCDDCMDHYEIKKGMMLEAVDIKTRGFVCAASIADFDEENVRIHFDGWSTMYDYWCPRNHPNLAPIGTAEKREIKLHEPHTQDNARWDGPGRFNWKGYLKQKNRQTIGKGFFDSSHNFWDPLPPHNDWKDKTKDGCWSLDEYAAFLLEYKMRGLGIKGAY